MKNVVIQLFLVWVVSVGAATTVPVGPAPTPPTNAYWHIISGGGGNVLACVLEGQTVYGNGDDCRIRNLDAFDFTDAVTINAEFDIKNTVDSANDHCLFQIRDLDDSAWTTIEDFDSNTSGYEHRSYDLINGPAGNWSGKDEVFVRFRWISNGSGTADGTRIDDFLLEYGTPGTYTKTNIFQWSEDHANTHEVHNCATHLDAGDGFYFEWNYDTNDHTLLWHWYIDNVLVYDPDGDLLPTEPFNDWLPAGWSQNQHSENGKWEQISASPSGNPPCAGCNSYGHPTWEFNASLYSPTMSCVNPNVTVDFWSDYNNYSGIDMATFAIWVASPEVTEFADDFEGDLGIWKVVDSGSGNVNVEPLSIGVIKAAFR
jgi:hypothetical protein